LRSDDVETSPSKPFSRLRSTALRDHLTEADVLLTRAEAAEYLRRSVPTLERWAAQGAGPDFRLVGGRALYPLTSLRAFAGVEPA
jgi:Helix-turn-helix domain